MIVAADEFLNDAPLLPPNLWDPTTRIEPPDKTPQSAGTRKHIKIREHTKTECSDGKGEENEKAIEENGVATQSYYNHAFYLEPDYKPNEDKSSEGSGNNDNNHNTYYIDHQNIELDSDDEEEMERKNMGLVPSGR